MLVRKLVGVGVHTYIGILGYCVKNKGEDHIEVVHHNVTNEELEVGLKEHVKFGIPFAKNKVVITFKNLLERCLCYLHFKMHKQLYTFLAGVLLQMCHPGTFIPDAQSMVPQYCGGMDSMRADAIWKCMVMPSTLMLEDICQIFFHHTSYGSCLRDLGCQRLVADLTVKCKGAQHLYHPLGDGNDKGNPGVEEDDLHIVKVISPNLEGNLNNHPQKMVQDLSKYILVIFGNHDVNNHLSLS